MHKMGSIMYILVLTSSTIINNMDFLNKPMVSLVTIGNSSLETGVKVSWLVKPLGNLVKHL